MKKGAVLLMLAGCLGCERYLYGLYAPIPPYQEPDQDMRDGGEPDVISNVPDSLATPIPEAVSSVMEVTVSWSPVPDAEYYEIQIDDGPWTRVEDTQFVDAEAPGAIVREPSMTATDKEFRDFVRLEVLFGVEKPPKRAYRVRAVSMRYALVSEASEAVMGQRLSEPNVSIMYRDDPSSDEWLELDVMGEGFTYEDTTAPGSGASREYRCSVSMGREGESVTCAKETQGRRLAVEKVYAGGDNTCVLFNTKRLKCWGNGFGNVGFTSLGTSPENFPLPYIDVQPVDTVWMGSNQTFVLEESGDVKCWGANMFGQLALGDLEHRSEITVLPFLNPPEHIGMRATFGCSVTGRAITCWGQGSFVVPSTGIVGGDPMDFPLPTLFLTPNNSTAQVVKVTTGLAHACILFDRRAAFGGDYIQCWGFGDMLASGSTQGVLPTTLPIDPPEVTFSALPQQLATGSYHNCVLLDDGTVRCWGNNNFGQLGRGDRASPIGTDMAHFPLDVVNLPAEARFLSAGEDHTCAILADKSVVCWGLNERGQLGAGDTRARGDSADDFPLVSVPLPGEPVELVSGNSHTCALLNDGEVTCWGDNGNGQLGYGDTDIRGDQPEDFPLQRVNVWD